MAEPWWAPARHEGRRERLLLRQRLITTIRSDFEAHGFIETACGALAVSPGNEAHLHAVKAEVMDAAGTPHGLYLHTSPEFAMKKLLAAGEQRLFEFARVFRARETGRLNAPEFTMLEWYRANEPYETGVEDALRLLRLAAQAAGVSAFRYRGRIADMAAPPRRLTVAQAFARYADIDLLAAISDSGEPDRPALAASAESAHVRVTQSDTWSDIFSRVLAERIEPNLREGVIILDEYPRPEAALARVSRHDPRVSERFEIFVAGVELANGFGELTDPAEQRRRLQAEMDEKQRVYGERYPIDEELIAALALMPPASGVALGFDRLVMLASDARHIDDVLWTPPPRLSPR